MTEQSAVETLREIRARFAAIQATLEEAQEEEGKANATLIAEMAENDRLRAEISTLKGFQQNAPKDADYIVFFDSDIPELEAARARIAELEAYADKLARGLPEGMLPKDVENLRVANVQMAARIAELEAARRWVPVGERLPEDGNPVLAYGYSLWTAHYVKGEWYDDVMDERIYITHWQPLPPEPEEE